MIIRYYPEIDFAPIFEIIMHEKNSLIPKKFHFRRPIFINQLVSN